MKIINNRVFNSYNILEKGLFEAFRDSILKIIYYNDGSEDAPPLDDEYIKFAEESAMSFVTGLPFEFVDANTAIISAGGAAPTSGTKSQPLTNTATPQAKNNVIGSSADKSGTNNTSASAGVSFAPGTYVLKLKTNNINGK